MILWKIPRLPLCRLRKWRGCNQSSGCFSHNPLCLCLALPPHQRNADYWELRWEKGCELGSQQRKGGADVPLQNVTATTQAFAIILFFLNNEIRPVSVIFF